MQMTREQAREALSKKSNAELLKAYQATQIKDTRNSGWIPDEQLAGYIA